MGKTLVIKDADFSDVAVEKRTVLYSRHGAISQAVDSGISILAQDEATVFVKIVNPTNPDATENRFVFEETPSSNNWGNGLQCLLRTDAQRCYVYIGGGVINSSDNIRDFSQKLVIQKDGNNLYIITDLEKDNPSTVDASKFGSTTHHLWIGGWDRNVVIPSGNTHTHSFYDVHADSLDVVVYQGIVDYESFL